MSQSNNNDSRKRAAILQTHTLFTSFLTKDIINNLINLFQQEQGDRSKHKIIKYIEDERKRCGLNTNAVTFKSEVYGHNNNNSTLYLGILKDGNEFIHLSIHIAPDNLDTQYAGIIHIRKDIYYNIMSRKNKKRYYHFIRTPIKVEHPINKPNSLRFSITDGYTSYVPQNANVYEPQIKQEIDVILTVLNNMFDEDNELYVGRKHELYEIHPKTNNVLTNINRRVGLATRKNWGSRMFNTIISAPMQLSPRKNRGKTRKQIKPANPPKSQPPI